MGAINSCSCRLAVKLYKKSVSAHLFSTSAGRFIKREAGTVTLASQEECESAAQTAIKLLQSGPEGCPERHWELIHTSYQCQPLCGLARYVKIEVVIFCNY